MSDPKIQQRIVERECRTWDARHRAAAEQQPAGRPMAGGYVTVSRQLGSGGTAIARELAQHLGWQLLDREILQQIAAETQVSEPLLEHHDERAAGPLEDYLGNLLLPGERGHAAYTDEVARVVREAAHRGRVVIVGRGANWLLPPRHGVRVRFVAPLEWRAQQLARREEVSIERALARLAENDDRQRRFVRQLHGREIDDPCGYDAVFCTASCGSASILRAIDALLVARVGDTALVGTP